MESQLTLAPAQETSAFEARVIAARFGGLKDYAKAVHNLDIEPYQEAWFEALTTLDRTLIVCPPDTYKSTTVRMWCEQQIGLNPNIRILWLQKAGDQSLRNVMSVQQTIESNAVYKAAFGVQPDPSAQWTKSVLYVKRTLQGCPDPTLMGCGLNGPYQGSHFDVIVIDDPTNQEDVYSEVTMEMQVSKLRGVIIDRLVDDGRIVGLLTRWGENDLVPTFEDMGFTLIIMPVVGDYPWGPTLSNRKFSEKRLEVIRRDKTDRLFNMTFMCDPSAAEGYIIRREHIGYWDKLPDTPLNIYMGVDPAASTRTAADNSAIAAVGTDFKSDKLYCLSIWANQVEVPDLEREIDQRCRNTAGFRGIGLETVGFQLSLVQGLKRRTKLPILEIPYRTRRQVTPRIAALDRDKGGRAAYLDSLFASGRLLLPKDVPLLRGISIETELCHFGYEGNRHHDDRGDALAIACVLAEGARRPFKRRVRRLYGDY